jgi:hypothetical protein
MIEKVWANWINDFLLPSLPHGILLHLGLTEYPAMVTRVLDLYAQRPDILAQEWAPGTRLSDIFDRMDQALLILGAPGTGKTTLLLQLARELLLRAAQDPEHPIPVIFPLSSWAQQRQPLAAWLVDALNEQYDVPRKTGQAWVEADQVLPPLDGLDEVQAGHRAACVEAINIFRQDHGLLPLVVCSGITEYKALGVQLRLQGAIVVQPLTRVQVDSYLTQIGEPLAAVRQVLQEDPQLWELLDTPLMLTVVTLAYAGQPAETLLLRGTLVERRQSLFTTYGHRMFQRRRPVPRYPQAQTERWLAWLAWQLMQHSQTDFYLERLQPDWLPVGRRWLPTQSARLLAASVGGLLGGLPIGLVAGLANGLIIALITAFIGALTGYSQEITPIEMVRWSWSKCLSELLLPSRHSIRRGLFVGLLAGLAGGLGLGVSAGLLAGLAIGLALGLSGNLDTDLSARLGADLLVGMAGGLGVGLIYKLSAGLAAGMSGGEITTKAVPNEGIHRSARMAVSSGLLAGLGLGLLAGLGAGLSWGPGFTLIAALLAGLLTGPLVGLTTGLRYGGRACLQHLVLRLSLRYYDCIPRHYVDFLDYAAERLFLRRVGSGYRFIHRLLQEHFAALYQPDRVDSPPQRQPSPP